MQTKFGAPLDFLVAEFTKLEAQLSQEVGLNAVSSPRVPLVLVGRSGPRFSPTLKARQRTAVEAGLLVFVQDSTIFVAKSLEYIARLFSGSLCLGLGLALAWSWLGLGLSSTLASRWQLHFELPKLADTAEVARE